MKEELVREIELGKSITASLENHLLKIKGPKGEVKRNFVHPKLHIFLEGTKIVMKAAKATKKEKMMIGSFEAHVKNMVRGVQELHIYKLKICSGHFPMNVGVSGQEFTIKNFLGESVPRMVHLPSGVEVKISGTDITISSPDKELAGLTAAKIENLCRITKKDVRIFQDGCYITQKDGKDI